MLLMIENGIRGGITQASHRYAEANNKYMKNNDRIKESSYVDNFRWVKNLSMLDEKFRKNYCKDSDIGYTFEGDIEYYPELHDLHSDLPFLPERMKINKCNKLVCTLYDKKTMLST